MASVPSCTVWVPRWALRSVEVNPGSAALAQPARMRSGPFHGQHVERGFGRGIAEQQDVRGRTGWVAGVAQRPNATRDIDEHVEATLLDHEVRCSGYGFLIGDVERHEPSAEALGGLGAALRVTSSD